MGLRWRWTLILAAASAGLMLVAGVGIESTLRARIGVESREWEDSRVTALQARLLQMRSNLADELLEITGAEELALAFSAPVPTDAQRRAGEDWVVLRVQRGVADELLLLDGTGHVLTCSAHPERAGLAHGTAARLARVAVTSGLVWREHVSGDALASNWRLSVVRQIPTQSGPIFLVASRILDDPALVRLRDELDLLDLAWGPPGPGAQEFEFPARIQRETGAHLSILAGVPADIRVLRSLRIWLLAAVGVALLIGILGAPWIAAGFGRPLEEMSGAMERIGRGARTVDLRAAGPPEIRRVQTALRRLVLELAETEERVRQAERQATGRELARHIAHEIRNTLSPLALALDNVETGVGDQRPDLDAGLRVARDQIESLSRLATEFSEHARAPEPRLRMLVIEDLLESVAQSARAAFTGLDLRVERSEPPDSVDGDAEQLRRAAHNLIKNAVEIAPGQPVILRCGGADSNHHWWIEVQDQGPGLPESVERRFGEPQVSTRAGGAGLGLAVVSQVATAHGGALQALRPATGGSILRLVLDTRPEPAAREGNRP